MYKAKGIRDKKGKLVGGAYMMKNRAGNQSITAETGAYREFQPTEAFPKLSMICRNTQVREDVRA